MQKKLLEDDKPDNSPDPVDTHVGVRLKQRRNLLAMSQEALAKAVGLTFQQIQKYERGANRMGASRLYQFAQILNVPVSWFFEDLPSTPRLGFSDAKQTPLDGAPTSMPDADILRRRETTDLIRAYYNITDQKQRRRTLDLIKGMADKGGE